MSPWSRDRPPHGEEDAHVARARPLADRRERTMMDASGDGLALVCRRHPDVVAAWEAPAVFND